MKILDQYLLTHFKCALNFHYNLFPVVVDIIKQFASQQIQQVSFYYDSLYKETFNKSFKYLSAPILLFKLLPTQISTKNYNLRKFKGIYQLVVT